MPQATSRRNEIVEQAAALARSIAPDLTSILITHYPDADTLDTLRPGETDIETVLAVNLAVAAEMAAAGVEVLVQRADKPAFRRWMHGREATPENHRAWINRGHLLRGAAALEALGLKAAAVPPRPTFGKAPGPFADRLLKAFDGDDGETFDELVEALLDAGRADILDLAVRKTWEYQGDEAAGELTATLLAAAEGGAVGPSGWAELVALPVALPTGEPPDAGEMGEGLIASGMLGITEEVRFLPGWRSPDAIAELQPGAVRRVLLDVAAGKEPRDLPPGDTDDLARRGFGVLLGLRIDWAIPVWDEIAAAGALPQDEDETEETEDEARRAALFDRWRGAVFEQSGGCVPLALVPLSEVGAEIAAFLAEAGQHTGGIEDIRQFVAAARCEAGGEEVLCRPEVNGDALELTLTTRGGRFLDSLTLPADRMPTRAEDMVQLIGSFVLLVRDGPKH